MQPSCMAKLAAVVGLFLFGLWYTCCSYIYLIITFHVAVLAVNLRHRKLIQQIIQTWPRDFKGIKTLVRVKRHLNRRLKANIPLGQYFSESIVARHPRKVAFIDVESGAEMTFRELDDLCNQIANYFYHEVGLREGDVVSLFMDNAPEYVAVWLGLSKIGVVTALINFNLKLQPLAHCINQAESKCIITTPALQPTIDEVRSAALLEISDARVFVFGDPLPASAAATNLWPELEKASKLKPAVKTSTNFKDSLLCYIYTSGTTGLPKAAKIKHLRYFWMARSTSICFNVTPENRIYITMPMYHTAAGILGVGQTVLNGCTSVIRRKFSASKFWDDAVKYNCTVSQYIGEIARYLLAQPFRENETKHSIWLLYGNGFRPQIWEQFTERFGIKQIGEFYGSTEGNSNIVNLDNRTGAVGFLPIAAFLPVIGQLLRPLFPVSVIRINEETGETVRDENGLCILADRGECGEMVGRIKRGDPLMDFQGYASAKDTAKKVIRDVFTKGDSAFSSGDILSIDELGYLYFKDRTGDTFRWKGENVSTTEVEMVIQKILGLHDATVFGVELPGVEGRAGMAAIQDQNQNVDMGKFVDAIKQNLPAYARPVFLRIVDKVEQTGTFKIRKVDLQKQSFYAEKCGDDKLFYANVKSGQYEPLTKEIEEKITSGALKF